MLLAMVAPYTVRLQLNVGRQEPYEVLPTHAVQYCRAMPAEFLNLFVDAGLVGALSFLAAVASAFAAYFAGRQLYQQRRRWLAEDARVGPTVRILLSGTYSSDGWFHGVWEVTNRATFPLELVRIEAREPKSLLVGSLDPTTDGPVEAMKVLSSGKFINCARVVPVKNPPRDLGNIGSNFLYKISSTPDKDRGRTIGLRFVLREIDNPSHRYVRRAEAVIPLATT